MVIQAIQFEHDPARVRRASFQLATSRLKEPLALLMIAALVLALAIGMVTSHVWLIVVPVAVCIGLVLHALRYILTSPRNFCGIAVGLSIQEDGMHFTSLHRSGFVGWGGFKRIYQLEDMWALFLHRSETVTFIPVDQFDRETIEFILAKLQENHVRINGVSG